MIESCIVSALTLNSLVASLVAGGQSARLRSYFVNKGVIIIMGYKTKFAKIIKCYF